MEPASDAIKQNPRAANSLLLLCGYRLRAQLRRNQRAHGWMGLRFQLQPGGPPTTCCCTSNLLDPSNFSSRKPSGFWASISFTPRFTELQTKDISGRSGTRRRQGAIEIDYVDLRGQRSRAGIAAPCSPHWCTRDSPRLYFPIEGPQRSADRDTLQESIVLAPEPLAHVDATQRASSRAIAGFGEFRSFGRSRAKQRRRPSAFFWPDG